MIALTEADIDQAIPERLAMSGWHVAHGLGIRRMRRARSGMTTGRWFWSDDCGILCRIEPESAGVSVRSGSPKSAFRGCVTNGFMWVEAV